jgi:hypothetical protein
MSVNIDRNWFFIYFYLPLESNVLSINFDCDRNENNSRRCLAVCCIRFPQIFWWCKRDVKMSKLDNGGKAMSSMHLSILITEINICNRRN